jgi:hypothetical protein
VTVFWIFLGIHGAAMIAGAVLCLPDKMPWAKKQRSDSHDETEG